MGRTHALLLGFLGVNPKRNLSLFRQPCDLITFCLRDVASVAANLGRSLAMDGEHNTTRFIQVDPEDSHEHHDDELHWSEIVIVKDDAPHLGNIDLWLRPCQDIYVIVVIGHGGELPLLLNPVKPDADDWTGQQGRCHEYVYVFFTGKVYIFDAEYT